MAPLICGQDVGGDQVARDRAGADRVAREDLRRDGAVHADVAHHDDVVRVDVVGVRIRQDDDADLAGHRVDGHDLDQRPEVVARFVARAADHDVGVALVDGHDAEAGGRGGDAAGAVDVLREALLGRHGEDGLRELLDQVQPRGDRAEGALAQQELDAHRVDVRQVAADGLGHLLAGGQEDQARELRQGERRLEHAGVLGLDEQDHRPALHDLLDLPVEGAVDVEHGRTFPVREKINNRRIKVADRWDLGKVARRAAAGVNLARRSPSSGRPETGSR